MESVKHEGVSFVVEEVEQIAKDYRLPLEEVKAKYEELLAGETKLPKEERALSRLQSTYKRAIGGFREEGFFKGIIVGARDLVDIYEQMRAKSLRLYENPETKERALIENYVSELGIPLDYREKTFGRNNPDYGKPLTGSSFQRELYTIATKEDGDGTFSFWSLTAKDKRAQELEVPPLFKPFVFRAGIQRDRLGVMGLTRFMELDEKWDIEDIIKKAMPCYMAHEIESYLESKNAKERAREAICVEGRVLTEGLATKNRYIDIDDKDMKGYIRCFLRGDVVVDFGEDSRVLVIGTPNYGRGGQGFTASVYGVYSPFEDRYPLEE